MKIGISAWSFYRRFLAKPPTMDYPQFFAAVRGLGVDAVELNSPFFDSQEHDYITYLKGAADSYGVHINNIAIDDGGYDLSSADSANREEAIKSHRQLDGQRRDTWFLQTYEIIQAGKGAVLQRR